MKIYQLTSTNQTNFITQFFVISLIVLLSACSGGGASVAGSGSQSIAVTSLSTPNATTPTPHVSSAIAAVPTPQTLLTPTTAVSVPQAVSTSAIGNISLIQSVPVQFTYTLASNTIVTTQVTPSISLRSLTRRMLSNAGYVGYTSTAAPISISITVTPVGGSVSGPYTGSCTSASTGTSGTCTVTGFTAAPGPTTIAGTVTESGNTIASFSNLTIIQPSAMNSLNFTANPVVASVSIALSAPTTYLNTTLNQTLPAVTAGTPYDVPVVINAYDANGKVIAGTKSYVDSNGNPISLILNITNSQAGGKGTVVIKGPTRVTAPGQPVIFAHYDGNWLDYSTIAATATSSAVTTSGATVTLTTKPHVYEYTAAGNPVGIVAGPDGNIWFAEFGSTYIGRISTAGTNYTAFSCGSCMEPFFITRGPDNNLWFTEDQGLYIDKITVGGTVTRVTAAVGSPIGIVTGPDQNLWYTSIGVSGSPGIGKVKTSGKITNYLLGYAVNSIAVGPDGNLWYVTCNNTVFLASCNTNLVGELSTAGQVIRTYSVSNLGSDSDGIAVGPDGNVWISNNGSNKIDKIVPGGSVTEYSSVGSNPRDIVAGLDGNLYYTEPGSNSIGSITTSGVVSEFGSSYGINTSSAPIGIALGPDGNIWFTEFGSNTIGKFIY